MIGNMDRVKIDRFGRVLIPKKVRDRLGLETDDEISLEVEGEKLILENLASKASIVRKGNALVFDGVLPKANIDWVARDREDRVRQILESDTADL